MYSLDEGKDRMCTWKQGYLIFLAEQESRESLVCFISDVSGFTELFVSDSWYCQI